MSAPAFSVRALAERVIAESTSPLRLPTGLPTVSGEGGESTSSKSSGFPSPPGALFPCVSCGVELSECVLFCPSCWEARFFPRTPLA